jgi:hypothetical protein
MTAMTATQAEFQLSIGDSQGEKILAYLQARKELWVPMPELWHASGAMAVHSRVADLNRQLRGSGAVIKNRVDRSVKPYRSFYRLQNERPF